MTNPERCSCGAREKSKCSKESEHGSGKMCVKDEDTLYINFRDTLNGGFCADIDYESQAWQKVLSDWEDFSKVMVPVPQELFDRMEAIMKKAEENRLKEDK